MPKMSGHFADRLAKLRRKHRNGPVYYRTPPTTALLQTKSSDIAPVFDYYGSLIFCWLISLLAVLGFTGGRLFPALFAATAITWLFGRWRRIAGKHAAHRMLLLQGTSLCRENIGRIIAEGRFFTLLSELLPHFAYQNISYLGQRSQGLELAMANRHGQAVLIAFFTPTAGEETVSKETAEALRNIIAEFAPTATAFFTATPLSLTAVRLISRAKEKSPVTVYDRERLVALCRTTGHPAYPSDASTLTGRKIESTLNKGAAKEMTATQGIAAAKRKMNTHLFTAGLLFLLALWLPTNFGIKAIYFCFAVYNLGKVFFCFAIWRQDSFLQNDLLAPETKQTAE
ncbi:MAG: hypothetical protein ACOX8W_00960 [bacterium]|jgi:hypothetical protein